MKITDVKTHLVQPRPYNEPVFNVRDGAIFPSGRPGLGIELNMEGVARHSISPDDHSKTPVSLRPGLGEGLEGHAAAPRRPSRAGGAQRRR